MISLNKITITLAFFSIGLLSSCNSIKDIEYKGIKETKIQSLGLNKGTVRIVLQYHNPNKFGLDVKETQLEVYANGKYIGIAENAERNKVPKASDFDFPILVHFNPLKALGMVGLLKENKIKLRVKGTTKVGKSGVFVRVPVDVTEEVSMN
jgi:LEA14-like dessication related protein